MNGKRNHRKKNDIDDVDPRWPPWDRGGTCRGVYRLGKPGHNLLICCYRETRKHPGFCLQPSRLAGSNLPQARFWTACGFGNNPLCYSTKDKDERVLHLHIRSAGLHQIAKDSDSGALVLSGLLNSPDLREF